MVRASNRIRIHSAVFSLHETRVLFFLQVPVQLAFSLIINDKQPLNFIAPNQETVSLCSILSRYHACQFSKAGRRANSIPLCLPKCQQVQLTPCLRIPWNKPISICILRQGGVDDKPVASRDRHVASWLSKLVIHRLAASCFNKL